MRNFFLFCLLLLMPLQGYQLQKEYFYTDPTIVSTDLFPGLSKRFEIVRIPEEKTLYRMDLQTLSKTFELHGIPLEKGEHRYVTFHKKSAVDLTPFHEQLSTMLQRRYPSLRITSLTITPRGYLESLPQGVKGVFDEHYYLTPEGTFYVIDTEGIRRYLDYRVEGTLNVLHTSQKISPRETLSASNATLKTIPFHAFRAPPLTALPTQPLRYRGSLKPSTPLNMRHVEPLPLVLKNETVVAVVRNGAVELELIVTATQEGALYDIITVQKRDGKRSRAKVIGEKRVELQ